MSSVDRGVRLDDGQRDYNHATDSTYKNYRAKADELYQKRSKLSQQSQSAYKSGDKARAHELSEQAKKIVEEAEEYNRKAAEYVFRENNADLEANEIDLHGLYVKEAEYILQNRIAAAIRSNQSQLRVIVGKGHHSAGGIAKLKPAIDQMCDECNLQHHIDPKNTGVLVIDLNNTNHDQIPQGWSYQGTSAPTYANNNTHTQQQQLSDIKTGNALLDGLISLVCMCLKK